MGYITPVVLSPSPLWFSKSQCGGHKAKHWSGFGACCRSPWKSPMLVQLAASLMVWVCLTKLSNWFQQRRLVQTLLISCGTMHQTYMEVARFIWKNINLPGSKTIVKGNGLTCGSKLVCYWFSWWTSMVFLVNDLTIIF